MARGPLTTRQAYSVNGDQLVVVGDKGTPQSGSVSVLKLPPSPSPGASPLPSDVVQPTPAVTAPPSTAPPPTPTIRPTATPTSRPTVSPSPPIIGESSTPATEPPAITPSPSVAPSVDVTPSASPDGTVQIAHNVIVVGQAAAYSPSGAWFAFTARPSDGTAGPDIYVWRVGDAQAHPITTDHRSELGGWNGDIIVGSTAIDTPDGPVGGAFLIDPATGKQTSLPQAGNAWRPSVDPFNRQAVYWTGRLRPTTDGPGFAPDTGRLVIGTWGATTTAPSDGPSPTAPADQPSDDLRRDDDGGGQREKGHAGDGPADGHAADGPAERHRGFVELVPEVGMLPAAVVPAAGVEQAAQGVEVVPHPQVLRYFRSRLEKTRRGTSGRS